MRRGLGLVTAVLVSLAAPLAHGDPKQVCIDSHVAAQQLRKSGKLNAAREQLEICRAATCPAIARDDCARWLDEVKREQPSIVVNVSRPGGARVEGATLSLDGATLATTSGSTFVDPGTHVIRAEASGAPPAEATITVGLGDRDRPVSIALVFDEPAVTATARPVPTASWVLGAIGVLGVGSFAYFGLSGRAAQDDLDRCKPRCDSADVDATKTRYLVADVSLGVSVVALAAGAYLLFTRGTTSASAAGAHWTLDPVGGLRATWLARINGGSATTPARAARSRISWSSVTSERPSLAATHT